MSDPTVTRASIAHDLLTILAEHAPQEHLAAKPKGAKKPAPKRPRKQSPRAELSTALRKALKGLRLELLSLRGGVAVQHKDIDGPFFLQVDFSKDADSAPKWVLKDESNRGPRGSRAPGANGMLRPLQDLLDRVNPKGILALIPLMGTVEHMLSQALEAQQRHDGRGRRRAP